MAKKKKLSRTKTCLLAIAECLKEEGDFWAHFMIGVSHPLYRRTFMGGGTEAVRRRIRREEAYAYRQHLSKLKRQKWIAMRRIGEQIQIALTPRGQTIVLRECMKSATPCSNKECVIVVFDIPEKERHVRQQFRRVLKECNFKQLQRSVWVSTYDVLRHLKKFIRSTKSHEWIRAFRATNVEDD